MPHAVLLYVGDLVGINVGFVGVGVGEYDGVTVGTWVGEYVGASVGETVGDGVGSGLLVYKYFR